MRVLSPIVFAALFAFFAASIQAADQGHLGSRPSCLLPSNSRNISDATPPGDRKPFLSRLEDEGVVLELNYRGEAFHSFEVEPSGETLYRGLLDVYLGLDTGKGGLWDGGELFINFQNGHGKGFSINPAGVWLPISDIDAQDFIQISELGMKQNLLDGKLQLRFTKQDVNSVFCVNESGGDFIFPSFTLIPTVPMPTFPAPALGVTLSAEFTKEMSIGAGFYDGGPQVGRLGFDTFFEGEKGYFSVVEPAWKPAFGPGGKLPGNYRLGLWHYSGDFPETGFHPQPKSFDLDYGFYIMINQTIRKPDSLSAGPELGVFFQFGWAPADRSNVSQYWAGGLTGRGLVPGRSQDSVAVGLANMRLNGTGPGAIKIGVTHMELFYVARLTSWLALQPDLQYFTNVGPNQGGGLAVGLRSLVHF